MARLEELKSGASVKGILPDCLVNVVDVQWHGSAVVELVYKNPAGWLGNELLYRDREPTIEVVAAGLGALMGMALCCAWSQRPIGSA